MRILMMSFDDGMLAESGRGPGDTRIRHVKYAEALRQAYPEGRLDVLIKAPASMSDQPSFPSEALGFYPVPCRRALFGYQAFQAAKALLNMARYDLVTTQAPFDDGFVGVRLKQQFQVPLNIQMRSSFLDIKYWIQERPVLYRFFNLLGRWVSHRADTIRVVSHEEKLRLERRFPKLQGKILALHPLANAGIFDKPAEADETAHVHALLKRHNVEGVPFLLFAGRFVLQKNLPTLLRAYAVVRQKIQNALLVVAGDGPLYEELQQLSSQLGMKRNILWIGNLSLKQLRGWYAEARGFVLPSFHEGVPKVLLESYLMQTPVVAAPFVSAKELIQDGETGFITSSFTHPQELAEKMICLLEDEALAREMAIKGKAHVTRYLLSESVYMQRLLEIWEHTAACSEKNKGGENGKTS